MDALGTLKQVEERLSKTQIENLEKSESVKKQQQKEVILERKRNKKKENCKSISWVMTTMMKRLTMNHTL